MLSFMIPIVTASLTNSHTIVAPLIMQPMQTTASTLQRLDWITRLAANGISKAPETSM
jgi:hypothetical protein